MEIIYKRRIFTNEIIERFVNDFGGFYIIQDSKEIIYIGESERLNKELLDHISGLKGHYIKLSFYFSNRPNFDPSTKTEELLQSYREAFGRLPEYNETLFSFSEMPLSYNELFFN